MRAPSATALCRVTRVPRRQIDHEKAVAGFAQYEHSRGRSSSGCRGTLQVGNQVRPLNSVAFRLGDAVANSVRLVTHRR